MFTDKTNVRAGTGLGDPFLNGILGNSGFLNEPLASGKRIRRGDEMGAGHVFFLAKNLRYRAAFHMKIQAPMKSSILTTLALLLIAGPALTQSQRLNRTKNRKHNRVDSVTTWIHGAKDTAHVRTDTTRAR